MDDEYYTIAREASIETKVKGSRFIGESFLATSLDQALEKLESVRRREHAATHHCYAYLVGLDGETVFKYSDDGEPNGTAGKPIYDVVCGAGITNVLVVVTRYFGGTKLGTGGLVRAYSDAARLALEGSGKKRHFITASFRVELEFPLYDRWLKIINRLDAKALNSDFSDIVRMDIDIRRSRASELQSAFVELTAGKGKIEATEETSQG
jgi:uncharacterized YigZ family protein